MGEPLDPEWAPNSLADIAAMVVDDDPLITGIVEVTLHAMGLARVYAINDPLQALDLLTESFAENINGIQLIICDLVMPEISGLHVLEEARKNDPRIPFLMLTANRSPDVVSLAIDKGVSGYLAKPFHQKELQTKVLRLIDRRYGRLLPP